MRPEETVTFLPERLPLCYCYFSRSHNLLLPHSLSCSRFHSHFLFLFTCRSNDPSPPPQSHPHRLVSFPPLVSTLPRPRCNVCNFGLQNRSKNETSCRAGVSLEIYIQVVPSIAFKFHIQRRGGERKKKRERQTERERKD